MWVFKGDDASDQVNILGMHFFLRLLTCNELVWMDMNLSKLQEILEERGAWRAAAPEVTKSQT